MTINAVATVYKSKTKVYAPSIHVHGRSFGSGFLVAFFALTGYHL